MRRFIIHSSLFVAISCVIFLLILSTADGFSDPFYLRFTSDKQENLILGTSRAAQGLRPEVFKTEFSRDFFNYSFTMAHSPYGEKYLESIKKKLNPEVQNGVFIVTVDPWSISSSNNALNDASLFRENKLCVAQTRFVNIKPNFEYLFENFGGKYYKLLDKDKQELQLHSDGWLEVSVDMSESAVNSRSLAKFDHYKENLLPQYNFSELRFDYLKRTIEELNKHGNCYLVRLPVHPEIQKVENEFMPDFDQKIQSIRGTRAYLNFIDSLGYQFTDGNHLYKESAKNLSLEVCQLIKEIEKQK